MAVTPDPVYGDSQWARENPGLVSRFSQILVNSGIIPDQATLDYYHLGGLFDPNVSAAAANNPYSTAALLKNSLSGSLTNNATGANAHGALFSGAFQNMQDASGRAYQQQYAQAGAQTLSGLLGIQGQQNDLYNTIFQRQANAPVAADPTAYSTGVAGAPAPGGREADRPGGPAANPNPWHVPSATGAALRIAKPKKPVGFSGRAL